MKVMLEYLKVRVSVLLPYQALISSFLSAQLTIEAVGL